MKYQPKASLFDYGYYGSVLRTQRQRNGYNRAEDFCRIVTAWTGISITREALYRIEKGAQAPSLEQFLAFGLVLHHGNGMQDVLGKTEFFRCVTPYAEYLAERKGSITSAITYNGAVLDEISSTDKQLEFIPADSGMPGFKSVDERFLDES